MVFLGVIYLIMLAVLNTLFFATSIKKTLKEKIYEYFDTQGGKATCFAQMAFLWPIYCLGAIAAVTIDAIKSKYRDKHGKR